MNSPSVLDRTAWPYWLAASGIGICSADVTSRLARLAEPYSQFTVGGLTLRAAAKQADYFLLLGLFGGFVAAWLSLLLIERRVERRFGREGVEDLRSLVIYASLPLIVWTAALLIWPATPIDFVRLSAFFVVVAASLMLVCTLGPASIGIAPPAGIVSGLVMLDMLFGALSVLIAVLAINRATALAGRGYVWNGRPSGLVIAVAGAFAGLALGAWASRRGEGLVARHVRVMTIVQVSLPLAFLVVLPPPWRVGAGLEYRTPTVRILCVVFALVAATLADLFRRARKIDRRASALNPVVEAISPLALAAAILFIRSLPLTTVTLPADDYHFGEFLLPWWSLTHHGAVPFWDYVPGRGLINYANAMLASAVFDGSALSVLASNGLFAAFLLMTGIWSLSLVIGVLPAAAAYLLMPLVNGVSEIDCVNTTILALLLAGWTRLSATAWIIWWAAFSMFTFLWSPPQGTALVAATAPLAVWRLLDSWRHQRRTLVRGGLTFAALTTVAVSVTPLGRMLLGAVRYSREHGAIAGPAHAVEWSMSSGSQGTLNHWLWEGVRASWMVVGLAAAALMMGALVRTDRPRRDRLFRVGVPTVLLSLIFIYRAAGRIDPGNASRLGFASIWMFSLLLPMLLHAAWGPGRWPLILTMTMGGAGLLSPPFSPIDLRAVARQALDAIVPPAHLVDGAQMGLPNLARAGIDPDHEARLTRIKRVLDVLLDEGDTYLDLTNRNAHYFYLGREVPIESGALYSLPNDRQQLRSIASLERKRVPVVLAWADPLFFDAGPASYRTYAIYRYVLMRYTPIGIDGFVYLVRPDRIGRINGRSEFAVIRDPLPLLDIPFRMSDALGVPASWGGSWSTLSHEATSVRALSSPPTVIEAEAIGPDRYRPRGPGPTLRWDLSASPIAGREAGLLAFDFSCTDGNGDVDFRRKLWTESPWLEVSWSTQGAAADPAASVRFKAARRMVVPLDAAPRWLLSPAVGALQIRMPGADQCGEFSVAHVELWQRRIVRDTDPR